PQVQSAAADLEAGRVESAEETLRRALAGDPNNSRAHFYLAVALRSKARAGQAQPPPAAKDRSPGAAPLSGSARAVYQEAQSHLETAVRLEPELKPAYRELAIVRYNLQDTPGAAAALEQYAHLAPGDAEAQFRLADMYRLSGRLDLAEPHFEEAARL